MTLDRDDIHAICEALLPRIDVSLIIVDTLARHINGHENDTLDMGTFVNHIDALKYRLGAAAIVVHHTGHQDTGRARGNTSFRAALDTEMICDKGTLTFTKSKDAEPPEKIEFKLHQVVIGTDDETGEDITSAVCVYGECSKSNKAATMTPFESMALDALITVCIAENDLQNGQYSGSFDAWRNEFYRLRRIEDNSLTAGTLKKSFQLVIGTTNRGGGLKGKEFVGFAENRGAIPLRLSDQDKIFNSILSNGNREQDGNKAGTVPVSGGGNTGTHLYNRCSLFPSDIPEITDSGEIEEIEEIPEVV